MEGFLRRNKNVKERLATNINRSRAHLKPEEMQKYFDELSITLKDVPPSNIFNYDETNVSDDTGKKISISLRLVVEIITFCS